MFGQPRSRPRPLLFIFGGVPLLVGSGVLAAYGDYLPYDYGPLAWSSPTLLIGIGAVGLVAGSALLAAGVLLGVGRPITRRGSYGDLTVPFVVVLTALLIITGLTSGHLSQTRDRRELETYGVSTSAIIVGRDMARRGRGGIKEPRLHLRYSTPAGDVYTEAWASRVATEEAGRVRVRYSSRYPHVHRVE